MTFKTIILAFFFLSIIFIIGVVIKPNLSLATNANDKYEQGSGIDTTAPDNPTLVRLVSQSNGITITWTDPTNIDFYQMLILRDYNSGQGNTLDNIYGFANKGEEQFTDTGAINGQTYTYILRPRDITGNINTNSVQYTMTHTGGQDTTTGYVVPTPPTEKPSNVSLISTDKGVLIEWTDPTFIEFSQIHILRNIIPNTQTITNNIYGVASKGVEQFLDTGAVHGANYTYYLVAKDTLNKYKINTDAHIIVYNNPNSNVPITISPTNNTSSSNTQTQQNINNANKQSNNNPLETIDLEPIRIINNTPIFNIEKELRDITAERVAIGPTIKLIKRLPQGNDWKFVHYLAYLGELRDILKYQSIYNTLPKNNNDWRDLKKIAFGFKPDKKSIEAETDALDLFVKIWGYTPQTKSEWRFLHIIAYDLIPKKRNLKKESASIPLVKKIPNIIFLSNKFWRLVHAYSYMSN